MHSLTQTETEGSGNFQQISQSLLRLLVVNFKPNAISSGNMCCNELKKTNYYGSGGNISCSLGMLVSVIIECHEELHAYRSDSPEEHGLLVLCNYHCNAPPSQVGRRWRIVGDLNRATIIPFYRGISFIK